MKTRSILCGFAALFVLIYAIASLGADYAQRADEYVQKELQLNRFMGSVIVARSNQVVFIKGYGLANRSGHEVSLGLNH